MFTFRTAVVALVTLWGQTSALDEEPTDVSNVDEALNYCHLKDYDNHCVRCIYEKGDFYSNNGIEGNCIKKREHILPSFVVRRETKMECAQLRWE